MRVWLYLKSVVTNTKSDLGEQRSQFITEGNQGRHTIVWVTHRLLLS